MKRPLSPLPGSFPVRRRFRDASRANEEKDVQRVNRCLAINTTERPTKWDNLFICPIRAGLGVMSLAEVRLQEGESLENALRRFKRKVQTEDIIKEVKRHSYYLKPGEKLRVKQALARKRARKKIRKEQD
jgi:small subunit ribosomal protein S21